MLFIDIACKFIVYSKVRFFQHFYCLINKKMYYLFWIYRRRKTVAESIGGLLWPLSLCHHRRHFSFTQSSGSGSGSAWIRIHFTSWIWIRIQGDKFWGKKLRKKSKKISDNCTFIFKNEVNMDQLHGFNIWATFLVFLKGNFFTNFVRLA